MATLAENRKAFFNYEILEKFEAGIELLGLEVKAIKSGRANMAGSFATFKNEEIYLTNLDVSSYQSGNTPPDYNSTRPRRLLLKKEEIKYLVGKMRNDRLTLVPLKLYTKGPKVKVELGLARGKRTYEKREAIKKREVKREIRRTLKT